MMMIALVTEFFYPTTGGTQTAVASLAERLGIDGHDTTVIAPCYSNGMPLQPSQNYVTVWVAARPNSLKSHLTLHWRIFRLLRGYDLIHLFHPAFGLSSLAARVLLKKPLIVNLMGYDTYDFEHMSMLKRRLTLSVCHRADILVSPSTHLARLAQEKGVKHPIELIQHGATIQPAGESHDRPTRESLHIAPDASVFVAVQRHYPIKQPTVFLEAWMRLNRPDCILILVGGGELEQMLRQQVKSLALHNLKLVGEVPRDEVSGYLALADVFVHHSRYESFAIGVAEAMSLGLPVIASDVGAIPELVTDGVEGVLYPPSNPEALARAVARLADSPSLRERLSHAARLKAKTLTWDDAAHRYLRLYQKLVSDNR